MESSGSDDYELMPKQELDFLRKEVSLIKKNSVTDGDKIRVLIESVDRLTISLNRLVTILDDAQKDIIDEYQKSKPTEKLTQLLDQNELIAKALIAISDGVNYKNSREVISAPISSPIVETSNNSRQPSLDNRSILSNVSSNLSASTGNINSFSNMDNTNSLNTASFNNSLTSYPIPNMSSNSVNNINNMSGFSNINNPNNNLNNTGLNNNLNNTGLNNNNLNNTGLNNNNLNNNFNRNMNNTIDAMGNGGNSMSTMSPLMSSIPGDFPPMDSLPPLNDPIPTNTKKKFLGIM